MRQRILSFTTGLMIGAALFGGSAAYAAGITAQYNPQTVDLDGRSVRMEAYAIDGYNYVKLRDIGQAVGFNVYWADNMVHIDSDAPYTGEAPAAVETNLEIRQEMIRLINQTRRANGVPELPVNDALMEAAQACSDRCYLWHHNREECEAVAAAGYPNGFGSNLAISTGTNDAAQRAVTSWINSPGHFQTMIDPDCDSIGVGITMSGGITYCYMFVGKPNSINPYG